MVALRSLYDELEKDNVCAAAEKDQPDRNGDIHTTAEEELSRSSTQFNCQLLLFWGAVG